ncbi:hypothetical protein [Rhodococcus artemisiae]|uniref:Antitoxin Xre/MbcA/ParS-like toxin-binding domain-containing protein n=1 Tax=Rhodococcus artemisiae TaxID=714159 RepID=A0ABU7L3V9_9NOCA|nr:hypothetical protein [Rhodococcus artemisiae]MEE2055949.1 hypothetical protein [Rhodococcus artemisiae]
MHPDAATPEDMAMAVASDLAQTRRNVAALGTAIRAAHLTAASPALARAVQAQQNLYDRIDAEFGLLTSAQAADRMSSRAVARRNAATAARREGRLLALRRGKYLLYPAFQFGSAGILPLIAALRDIGDQHGWDEASLIEWMMAPTTYLGGDRPVDIIDDADQLLAVATEAFGVSW